MEQPKEQPERIRVHNAETRVLGNSAFFLDSLGGYLRGVSSQEELIQDVGRYVRGLFTDLGRRDLVTPEVIAQFPLRDAETPEEYIKRMAGVLSDVIGKNIPLEDREAMEREAIVSGEGVMGINNVFYCIPSSDGRSISINMHSATSLTPQEILKAFNAGLIKLAEILKSPKFENIGEITMSSWLLQGRSEKLLNRYGFQRTGEDSANISREDFLKKYSSA